MKNKNHIDDLSNSVESLSISEIKKMIEAELSKDEASIDMDYIDACYEILQNKLNDQSRENKHTKIKFNKKSLKACLVAATISILMIASISVTANTYTIPNNIAPLVNGNAQVDRSYQDVDTVADKYTLTDSDFAIRLKAFGIAPITFPKEIIGDNCKITNIVNETPNNDYETCIRVDFVYNDNSCTMYIIQDNEPVKEKNIEPILNVNSGKIVNVNGIDVFVFGQNDFCTVMYRDNKTEYIYILDCNYKDAVTFAKSIK